MGAHEQTASCSLLESEAEKNSEEEARGRRHRDRATNSRNAPGVDQPPQVRGCSLRITMGEG
eukprot:scaffold56804_cov75-Attheya_sp.AAC.3